MHPLSTPALIDRAATNTDQLDEQADAAGRCAGLARTLANLCDLTDDDAQTLAALALNMDAGRALALAAHDLTADARPAVAEFVYRTLARTVATLSGVLAELERAADNEPATTPARPTDKD